MEPSVLPRLDSLPSELIEQVLFCCLDEHHQHELEPRLANHQDAITCLTSLCSTCKSISSTSTRFLYRSIILTSSSKVRLLARTLLQHSSIPPTPTQSDSSSSLPNLYHLLLASQDGLMSPNETITSQKDWAPSLKAIFTSQRSASLKTVALISRPSGSALETFLSKHTLCRPTNVSIYRLSVSTPPFSTFDLTPLSKVIHLNLVQIVPTEPLLDLLKSKPEGRFHPLSNLRISELDPESLLGFGEYVSWRKAFDEWELNQKNGIPASSTSPKPPSTPARRFSSQESIFSLASTLPYLEDFKLLILELSRLPTLPIPVRHTLETGEAVSEVDGSLVTTDWPSSLPSSLVEEQNRIDREERNRTFERDVFWMRVRDGIQDLKELIEENFKLLRKGNGEKEPEEGEKDRIEIRLVAPKSRGWDLETIVKDFVDQTKNEFGGRSSHGCWEDEDVFFLSGRRPWLGYARKGEEESDLMRDGKGTLKDWRRKGDGNWYTGDFPRSDSGRERTPFDFEP